MIKSFQLVNKEGCEWMGEIPSHWNLCSVWILFELGRGRVISNEEISDNAGEFPVYSSQTKSNGVMGHLKTYDFDGDYITWTTDGANAGTVFERHGKFNCTNVCGTLKSKDSAISLTYFRYAIELAAKYFVRHDINPKLMNGVMSRIKVPRPTIREQKSISIFINNKTFEIDRLVREKQKFINLLKEKRQALISHVVTKGLNPDVEMKDSGLLWAPKVPAHWDLKKLSYICKMQSGDSITSEGIEKTGSYRVFGGNGVRGYCEQYNHHGDYILVGRQGSLCGNVNYASGKFFASEHAVVVYPEKSVDMKWLGEALRIMDLIQYSVSAAIPGLSVSNILQLKLPYPPSSEQHQISEYICTQTSHIDRLIKEVNRSIGLLKEHRTALISAAVTGKIDLRDKEVA